MMRTTFGRKIILPFQGVRWCAYSESQGNALGYGIKGFQPIFNVYDYDSKVFTIGLGYKRLLACIVVRLKTEYIQVQRQRLGLQNLTYHVSAEGRTYTSAKATPWAMRNNGSALGNKKESDQAG